MNDEEKLRNENIEKIVADIMGREDRKDAEFRFAILTTELGDIGKYLTHDQKLNPGARPHGSAEDEKLAYGQVIVQLMALSHIRGINYNEALDLGLKNWLDADWRRREAAQNTKVMGQVGCPGYITAKAYVINSSQDFETLKNSKEHSIIVMSHAKPDFISAMPYVLGVVTDNGGKTCHAAINCIEKGIPCIVGTGNATELIKHGDLIELSADPSGENYVKILKDYTK